MARLPRRPLSRAAYSDYTTRMTSPGDDPLEPARRRGKRYIIIAFVAFSAAFILSSIAQLVSGVFGAGSDVLPQTRTGSLASGRCARELRALTSAVERAIVSAVPASGEAKARAAYRAALAPEWNDEADVEQRCSGDPHGTDAYAAVLRLRRAGEDFARRQVVELAPLRQDVAAHLGPWVGPEEVGGD
jgi:hypothetical protein